MITTVVTSQCNTIVKLTIRISKSDFLFFFILKEEFIFLSKSKFKKTSTVYMLSLGFSLKPDYIASEIVYKTYIYSHLLFIKQLYLIIIKAE